MKTVVLILMLLISSSLSYYFYGEYKQAVASNEQLVSSLKECESNKQKADQSVKDVSNGMSTVLQENEKITKDFQSLKDQLKQKRCSINATSTTGDRQKDISSVSPNSYVSDVDSLLSAGYRKANGVSEPTKSSP